MLKEKQEENPTGVPGISAPALVLVLREQMLEEDITSGGIGSLRDVLNCLWCRKKLGHYIELPWSCPCLRRDC